MSIFDKDKWQQAAQNFGNGVKTALQNVSTYRERMAGPQAPTFNDPGQQNQDMKAVYDKIMNRKDFQFDLNGNALYQQLRQSYDKQGQLGAMGAVGAAAAQTGGYGNSYAAAAGQQAYQQSLENLNDRLPDLYQMALAQYQAQGDRLMQQYQIADNDRAFQYQKYRDDMSDWRDQRNFEYQQGRDKVADSQWSSEMAQRDSEFSQNMKFQKDRAAASDAQWQQQFDYNQFLDNRNFEYQQGRDARADMESDRNYNFQVGRAERADLESDRNYEFQVKRAEVEDNHWDTNRQDTLNQQAIENALAEKYYGLDYSKYLSDEDQRGKDNARADAYLQLENNKFAADEDQRGKDNAYRDKNFDYMVTRDNIGDQHWAAEMAQSDRYHLDDDKYRYAALGLRYG